MCNASLPKMIDRVSVLSIDRLHCDFLRCSSNSHQKLLEVAKPVVGLIENDNAKSLAHLKLSCLNHILLISQSRLLDRTCNMRAIYCVMPSVIRSCHTSCQ